VSPDRKPFPLLDQLPDALRDVILDFQWDLDRLHALELPARPIAVDELRWHLDLPFWMVNGRPFQVSPREVAENPGRFDGQWERTMAADLSFPLAGRVRTDGRIVILDGAHRLLKAAVLRIPTVNVRILTESDLGAIAV
jgi:hypothetical protein